MPSAASPLVTLNVTGAPGTACPWSKSNWTTKGAANGWPMGALCESPATLVKLETVALLSSAKNVWAMPARSRTCTGPHALPSVTLALTLACESATALELLKVTVPGTTASQATGVWGRRCPNPSLIWATKGTGRVAPRLPDWLLPLRMSIRPGGPAVTVSNTT